MTRSFLQNVKVRYRASRRARAVEKSFRRDVAALAREPLTPPTDPALRARIDEFERAIQNVPSTKHSKEAQRAFENLDAVRHPYTIAVLKRVADSTKNEWVGRRAVDALGRLGFPHAVPHLLHAIRQSDAYRHSKTNYHKFANWKAAIDALGQLNHPLAVRALESLHLKFMKATKIHADEDVLDALNANPHESSVDALSRILHRTDNKQGDLIGLDEIVVAGLGTKATPPKPNAQPIDLESGTVPIETQEKAARVLMAIFARHPNPFMRVAALEEIPSAPTPHLNEEYVRALHDALQTPHPKVSDLAARALLSAHNATQTTHALLSKLDGIAHHLRADTDSPSVIGAAVRTALLAPASRQPRHGSEKLYINQLRSIQPRLKTA